MNQASAEAEQRAAEIDARENGEVLALARRAANAGTWDLDLVERIVRYCPRSLEMLGHSPDRSPVLTPEEWARHIFPGDAERVLAEGMRARDTGSDLITEYRIVKPDGGIRWIRGMGRTLCDANGVPVRSVGFNFDITEEKQTEAQFRKMQAELIQASRANAMATMAETLAHELNQPLTTISNYLAGARSVLARIDDDRVSQVRDALEESIEEAHRAAEIIMGLRALTRRATDHPGPVALEVVVQKAADLALAGADEQGVDTRIDFVPDLLVGIDELQLQQVVYNLVRHAVDAAEGGPGQIRISCRRDEGWAVLHVEERTGGGSRAEQDLNEPFAARAIDVAGIGLAIARTIVEANGGRLSMEPVEDGSAFTARLPLMASKS